MAVPLPKHLAEKTYGFGEYSYGVNRVTLVLSDGRRVFDVFLAWGAEIYKIGVKPILDPEDLDFQLADIVDIISSVK